MSKKYEQLAKDIVKNIGSKENVSTMTHCMTRIRFVLNENEKANKEEIEKLDGVVNVIESGAQFQIVIGPNVEEVYEEVLKLVDLSDLQKNESDIEEEKKGILNRLIDFVSGAFGPIIPAIAGAGMIRAFLALLLVFNLISKESQTYYVTNFIADSVFYFLPFLLAYSAANKVKTNPVFAMVAAGVLLHPNFIELVSAQNPVSAFGIPIKLVTYGSSVIPILFIVFVQSYIERFVKKITPDAVKVIFVPMITIFITGLVGLTLIGPLGSIVGDYMAIGFKFIESRGTWLLIILMSTLWPILVMFGIHYSISPLSTAQITTLGYENIIGPGAILSNISQGIAALVVSKRTNDKSLKQIAVSSGITGLMGITEPALYGVNLPKKYPLVAAMIGSGLGGIYAGVTNVSRYGTGASGLVAIPLYIGENIWNLYNILIALVITTISTAIITYILSLKYEKDVDVKDTQNIEKEKTKNEVKLNEEIATTSLEEIIVPSPMKGETILLNEVKDEAFSTELMGKGIAIEPTEGKVIAPFDGKVVSIFPTKHAIGIVSDNGVEMLIHIGINTVELNGKYFKAFVEADQTIKKGQTLITFEKEKIKEAGYITQVPIIITNTYNYSEVSPICSKNVDYQDDLLNLKH